MNKLFFSFTLLWKFKWGKHYTS